MSLDYRDRKIIWTKAGNQCSYSYNGEDCDEVLVISNGDDFSLVGDEAHIVGGKPGSARYKKNLDTVDTYENRILLCKKHHKIIDDNETIYTEDKIKVMKMSHEKRIEDHMKKRGNERLVIKDSVFKSHAENADLAIGMEVNQPAELSKVRVEHTTKNVKRSIGFSTNQGMSILNKRCENCQNLVPYVCTGPAPSKINCPHCDNEISTNQN